MPVPRASKLMVSVGEEVAFTQKVAEYEMKKIVDSYHLPTLLGCRAENSAEYVGRVHGELIFEGDLLGERLSSAGLVSKKIYAAVDGVVSTKRISEGYIDLISEKESGEILSSWTGKVTAIELGNSIEFEVDGVSFRPKVSPLNKKEQCEGELMIINKGDSIYTKADLASDYTGKVVYLGRFGYAETVKEILGRGANAVIVDSLDYEVYENAPKGKIFVLKGFGQSVANPTITDFLSAHAGYMVVIDPEFITVISASTSQYKRGVVDEYLTSHAEVGEQVIVKSPKFPMAVGEIIGLYDEQDVNQALLELRSGGRILVGADHIIRYID